MFRLKSFTKKILKSITQKNVIRKKLLLYFLLSAILVNSICFYTYNNTRLLINKLNQIFINDITLTNLSSSVDAVESSIKKYLTASHSEDLENYLNSSNQLRKKAGELKTVISNDESELLLLDIKQMIYTYLNDTSAAEYRKRGRDVNGYSDYFNEASQTYDYINKYIDKLKIYQFQENNQNYIQLDRSLGILQVFNMAVILVAMLVNIALIFWFTYSLTAPIIKLSKAAGEIADGNYDVPAVKVKTNDEVKTLALSFNRMADSIRRQLVEIRQKAEIESRLQDQEVQNLKMRTMLNEAQLKSLQAQINPHFMFNTLNAGMQLALFEGAERTQAFMEKLSESLRYNLGNIDKSATLKLEITNIDNYIYLLKERFGDKINYTKQIEPDLPELMMPRMILQPIVENSFIHGIGELDDGGTISLTATLDSRTIRVEIEDNGPGMPDDTIRRVLSEDYRNPPMVPEQAQKTGHSIGLSNVIERLILYYGASGPGQVVEISSGQGCGTKVTLKLPLNNSEDKSCTSC
jgi:two-component system, sensor histidine kinase YesM